MNVDTIKKTEAEKLFQDLNKPSLHALSYALRHPDTWPADFVWNFEYCDQCAMGLAHQLWKSIPESDNDVKTGTSRMARAFAMPYTDAKNIFFGNRDWTPQKEWTEGWIFKKTFKSHNLGAVTPDMVADQIDKYLAKAE